MLELPQAQTPDEYPRLDLYVVSCSTRRRSGPEMTQAALPEVRQAIAHLGGMLDVSRGALRSYDAAFK